MTKEYKVLITETLQKTVIVEAASEGLSEAERQTMYRALALVSENLERIYTHKKTAGDRAARDEQ